jgi:hypothetical protein
MQPLKTESWAGGSNNVAPVGRLPEGFVRSGMNVDFLPDGKIRLRPGRDLIAGLTSARAAEQYGDNLVIADGNQLKLYREIDSTLLDLGQIAGAGQFCGAELAGEMFICTANERIRLRGDQRLAWGIDQVHAALSIGAGRLESGTYRIAITGVTADGIESGAVPYVVQLPGDSSVTLQPSLPDGAVAARLYATTANGDTLFLQEERAAGSFVLDTVRSDTARLMTENLVPPPLGEQMTDHNAQLLIVVGNVLHYTEPYMPHLCHRLRGHITFPDPITVVVSVGSVVFVCADKTYAIQGLGTAEQQMPSPLGIGGLRGSGTRLKDGSAAWMTKYGQAIGGKDGSVSLPTRASFAPPISDRATASVLDHEGTTSIITTMQGRIERNGLGLSDHYDLEID